jgi:NAD(P)-dependent dehydrogenase (short-subunit alcohol dehydrogenase family)
MQELRDKVAVITGAASGMGRAMANRFAAEGMKIVLADIDAAEVEAVAAGISKDGGRAVGVATDVSLADSVEALAQRALEEFGAVHLVCNNAGVGGTGELGWEVPFSAWEWQFRVNVFGVVHGIRAFVPMLVKQGLGHVVNTSSMAGLVPGVGSTPYTASKYAVAGLSEALKLELEMIGSPVKVSVLIPGPVATRIGESLRHWPADLGPVPQKRQDGRVGVLPVPPVLKRALESKMDPSEVGELVLDGVLNDRFWILTHPDEVAQLVTGRTGGLLPSRHGRSG